MNPPTNNWG